MASVVFNSKQRYEVEPVFFNSEQSDFGTYTRGGALFFASSRKDEVDGGTYGWNDQPIDSIVIKLFDQKTKTLAMETMTDENGYYRLPINRKKIIALRLPEEHTQWRYNFATPLKLPQNKIVTQRYRLKSGS